MIFDTIVGIATLVGTSAINVIRVSGSEAILFVNRFFKGKDLSKVPSHTVHYGHIVNESVTIDEVMVTIFREPKSFTAENVVEISCHGGSFIAHKIVELFIKHGVRLAMPGEFTKRAFLNGRIDLTQAESIMDLINAKTMTQLRLANSGLSGEVRLLIETLQSSLLDIIANIEVNIDYPEYDDVEQLTKDTIIPKISTLLERIDSILIKATTGKVIRDGIKTAIIGKPNVGKSSLLNSLLKEDKAIVTDISGTTRDLVEGELHLGGIILKLIDTAGIRDTEDIVEKIGISRSKKALQEADLILLVLDQSEKLTTEDIELLSLTKDKKRIIVGNKSDLGEKILMPEEHIINISAKNQTGIELLEHEVKRRFIDSNLLESSEVLLANTRHIGKLEETKVALLDGLSACRQGYPIDLVEIDLKNAWENLGEITGDVATDSLVTALFSKFCLGK